VRARGVSMRPTLRPGDGVRLERRAPRRGDVALVAVGGRLVLHRLVRRRSDRWLVWGDARPAPDGWVDAEAVLAVATARRTVPDGRWHPLDGRWQRLGALLGAPLARAARRVWAARPRAARGAQGGRPPFSR